VGNDANGDGVFIWVLEIVGDGGSEGFSCIGEGVTFIFVGVYFSQFHWISCFPYTFCRPVLVMTMVLLVPLFVDNQNTTLKQYYTPLTLLLSRLV
jgi:hypothetical protein